MTRLRRTNAGRILRDGIGARLASAFRQWRFPREFRIAPATCPSEFQTILKELIRASEQTLLQRGGEKRETDSTSRALTRFLAEVGTNLWRLRLKMLQTGSDQPLEDMRRPYRHVESMWDTLTQEGVDIHDHTGELVPEGGDYGLKVLAYQPMPGVGREIVLETIKPSIRYRNQTIQMGEVIVATPDNPPNKPAASATSLDGEKTDAK